MNIGTEAAAGRTGGDDGGYGATKKLTHAAEILSTRKGRPVSPLLLTGQSATKGARWIIAPSNYY
jgi:hypothetical protein